MSKKDEIVVKVRRPKLSVYRSLPTVSGDDIKLAFRREARDIGRHFKKDGWDLDASGCFENALYEIFERHLQDLFIDEVLGMNKGKIVWAEGKFMKVE